jgi:hypothetical protein
MGDPFSSISALAGGVLGALGSVGAAQQQRWQNDFAINLLNRNDAAYNRGYEDWLRMSRPMLDGTQLAGGNAQSRIFDPGSAGGNLNFGLTDMWNQSSPYNPGNIMSTYGGQYNTPTTEGAQWGLGQLGGMDGRTAGVGDLAATGFAGGGWTPQRQQFLDQLGPLMQGMSPSQQAQLMSGLGLMQNDGSNQETTNYRQRGSDAVSQGGETPWLSGLIENVAGIGRNQGATEFTQGGQQAGMNLVNSGGYDPRIDQLMGSGMNILQSGGRTPQLDQGSSMALQGMGTGGQTAATRGLVNRGLDLFNRESLMTPEQAMSFAADESATGSKNAFEAVMRRAQARGGGAGANVAAGNATGVMADFADEAAENRSQAIRDALIRQQELGLRQAQMGLQGADAGQGQESSRLGMFGNLLNDFEGTASSRLGVGANVAGQAANTAANRLATGFQGMGNAGELEARRYLEALGLVPTAQNSATSRAGTIGGLGLTADQNDISRMQLGGNLLQGYTSGQQNALNGLNSFIGNQDQYALGLGGLANSSTNSQANILNQLFGNEQAAANTGLNRANTYSGMTNNMFQNAQAGNNANSNLLQGSWAPQVSLAGQGGEFGLQGLRNLGLNSAPTGGGSTSVWSNMAGGFANGMNAAVNAGRP